MGLIKGVLLDGKSAEVVEIEHTLSELHRIIDCDIIDITRRKIVGKDYWVVCDDCGLLRPNNCLTGLYVTEDFNMKLAFVGKIFVVGYNGFDDIVSLTEEEITHLMFNIKDGKLFIY